MDKKVKLIDWVLENIYKATDKDSTKKISEYSDMNITGILLLFYIF